MIAPHTFVISGITKP